MVLFNRKVDGVQSLIRDRVAVASSQETGRDLEHCKVLMRKFDDFEKVRVRNQSEQMYMCSDYSVYRNNNRMQYLYYTKFTQYYC